MDGFSELANLSAYRSVATADKIQAKYKIQASADSKIELADTYGPASCKTGNQSRSTDQSLHEEKLPKKRLFKDMQEEASTNLEKICSDEEANAYLGPCITCDMHYRFDSPVVKKEHYEQRQRVMRRHEETLSPLSERSEESQNFSRCFDSHGAWPLNFNLLQPQTTESDNDDGMQQELKEVASMIMMRRHAKLE